MKIFKACWVLCYMCYMNVGLAQIDLRESEKQINRLYGVEKLNALNELSDAYITVDSKKATKYAKQAVNLGEEIIDIANPELLPEDFVKLLRAHVLYGDLLFTSEKYAQAKEQFISARYWSSKLNDSIFVDKIDLRFTELRALERDGKVKKNVVSKAFKNLNIGDKIGDATQRLQIDAQIKLGNKKEEDGDYDAAIKHYKKAINLLKNTGETDEINEMQIRVALLLDSLNQPQEAQSFLAEALTEKRIKSIEQNDSISFDSMVLKPEPIPNNITFTPNQSLVTEKKSLKSLAEKFEKNNDYKRSLDYFKQYQALAARLQHDSISAIFNAQKSADEILLLKQQKRIADLNVNAIEIEKEKQIKLRNSSLIISFLIFIGAVTSLYFYNQKRKEHKKLFSAYRAVDEAKSKLEVAEERITTLLRQQVSGEIAAELLADKAGEGAVRRFVCVMFLDIRDFTPMAESMTPEELIAFQNNIFGFMIDIVESHHGNVNQLLGDGFMATFGAPVEHGNSCENAVNAAHAIIAKLQKRNASLGVNEVRVGIGLHAGNVVTGNVGNDARKQYSVTGNPVIIASRVEQLNKKLNSQLIATEAVIENMSTTETRYELVPMRIKGRNDLINVSILA